MWRITVGHDIVDIVVIAAGIAGIWYLIWHHMGD